MNREGLAAAGSKARLRASAFPQQRGPSTGPGKQGKAASSGARCTLSEPGRGGEEDARQDTERGQAGWPPLTLVDQQLLQGLAPLERLLGGPEWEGTVRDQEAQGSELTPVSCPWPQKVAEPHEEHRRGPPPFLGPAASLLPHLGPSRPSFLGQWLPIHAAHAGYEAPSTVSLHQPRAGSANCILLPRPPATLLPTGPVSV